MAKRPAYASRKSPITGTLEMGERVATTPRRKNPKGPGYIETGESAKSPFSSKAVKDKIDKKKGKKTSMKKRANGDPRMPRYS